MGWSGWQDLNLRRLHPKCSALPNWATSRYTTYWWREQYFITILVPRPQSALTSPVSSSPHYSILLLISQYVTVLLRPSAGCVSRNRSHYNSQGRGLSSNCYLPYSLYAQIRYSFCFFATAISSASGTRYRCCPCSLRIISTALS